MEKIVFDSGMKEYRMGGGVLRFNPGDPNLYVRFMEAVDKMKDVEEGLARKAREWDEAGGEAIVKLMGEADRQMKELLSWVFGPQNDFDKLLGGVNLLAVAGNGERVVTNVFRALEPVLTEGAKRCAGQQTAAAVQQARKRRAAQC